MNTGEVQNGISLLKQIVESERVLRLQSPQPLRGRFAFLFVVSAFEKEWDFSLSGEVLSDFPNMPQYKKAAASFARGFAQRFRNPTVNGFYCRSGKPISVEIEWPLEALPNRAASALRVRVRDTRDGKLAYCYVVITHQQSMFDLKPDPFLIQSATVNSIRDAVDQGNLTFYPTDAHPLELQKVDLQIAKSVGPNHHEIDEFLRGKVFRMAFKTGDSTTRVWVADSWDAEYLGCAASDLAQAAEVLEANNEINLDDSRQFGSAGRTLLASAREFEHPSTVGAGPSGSEKADKSEWDVFISHATEDKESFVRPLANLLQNRGVRVWFDEFALKLGDSLRRSIDRGLAGSKFGVVVLSPAFFSKEWPQRELDGLMAREISGGKIILPVWHNISAADVRARSPLLADRFAVSSSEGLSRVADSIISVLRTNPSESREP